MLQRRIIYLLCLGIVLSACQGGAPQEQAPASGSQQATQTPPSVPTPPSTPEPTKASVDPATSKPQTLPTPPTPPQKGSAVLHESATRLGIDMAAWRSEEPPVQVASLSVKDEAGAAVALSVDSLGVKGHIEGRMARVEVTQVFRNHLGTQTEGTYTFMLPAGASISRLAMDVDGKMVEGELVERERARNIYESIVRQQKDPALLEWQGGERFQTQIFPIPANGTKTVILAYDVLLPIHAQGVTFEYALPRVQGSAQAPKQTSIEIDAFGLPDPQVEGYDAKVIPQGYGSKIELKSDQLAMNGPLRLIFPTPQATYQDQRFATRTVDGELQTFFAVEHTPSLASAATKAPKNVVIALDTSASQGQTVLDQAKLTALLVAKQAGKDVQVKVVYGDLQSATCKGDSQEIEPLSDCLKGLDSAGASNLDALLQQAAAEAKTLTGPTAIVLLSDGAPSVGELDVDLILSRFNATIGDAEVTLHAVATGHSPAESLLKEWANSRFGHALRMTPVDSPQDTADALWAHFQQPLLQNVQVKVLSGEIQYMSPSTPQNVPAGEPIVVRGRLLSAGAKIQISGQLGSQTITQELEIQPAKASNDPMLSRFWARGALDVMDSAKEKRADISALSVKYGVMSKYTSFLVLENEEAYKRFEVERRREAEAQQAQANPTAPEALRKTDQQLQDLLDPQMEAKIEAIAESQAFGTPHEAVALHGLEGFTGDTGSGGLGMASSGLSGGEGGLGSMGGGGNVGSGLEGASGKGGDYRNQDGEMKEKSVSRPRLKPADPTVGGGFDKQIIKRVVNQKKAEITNCYQKELMKDPSLTGKISMKWRILASGSVGDVSVSANEMGNDKVADCLKGRITGWKFPAPSSGSAVDVLYPFNFSSDGAGATLEQRAAALEGRLDALNAAERAVLVGYYLDLGRAADADTLYASNSAAFTALPASEQYAFFTNEQARTRYQADWLKLTAELGPDHSSARDYLAYWASQSDGEKIEAHFSNASAATLRTMGGQVLSTLIEIKQPERAQKLLGRWTSTSVDNAHSQMLFGLSNDEALRAVRQGILSSLVKAAIAASDLSLLGEQTLQGALNAGMSTELEPLFAHWCPANPSQAPAQPQSVLDLIKLSALVPAEHATSLAALGARCEPIVLPAIEAQRRENKNDPALITQHAEILRSAGQAARADRVLSEIVEFDPHAYESRVSYAQAFQSLNRPLDACAQYATAVQTNPAKRDTFQDMMSLRRAFPDHAEKVKACVADGVSGLPVRRDLSVLLTWEDDSADIDFHIKEASGEEVNYTHTESKQGGLLYYDITNGFGPEIYVLGSTPSGKYVMDVHYFGGSGAPVSGTLTVMTNAGSPDEKRQTFPFTLKHTKERQTLHTLSVP